MKKKSRYKKEARTMVNPPKKVDKDKSGIDHDPESSSKPNEIEDLNTAVKDINSDKNGENNEPDKTKKST